jgi:hypothetical protein
VRTPVLAVLVHERWPSSVRGLRAPLGTVHPNGLHRPRPCVHGAARSVTAPRFDSPPTPRPDIRFRVGDDVGVSCTLNLVDATSPPVCSKRPDRAQVDSDRAVCQAGRTPCLDNQALSIIPRDQGRKPALHERRDVRTPVRDLFSLSGVIDVAGRRGLAPAPDNAALQIMRLMPSSA